MLQTISSAIIIYTEERPISNILGIESEAKCPLFENEDKTYSVCNGDLDFLHLGLWFILFTAIWVQLY